MELELTTFKLLKLISTILKIQQLPSLHLLFKLDILVFCVTPKCSLKGFFLFLILKSQWLGRWGCCSADPFPLDLACSEHIWGLGPGVEVSDPWHWRSWVLSAPSCSCWGPARTLCSEMKGPAVKPRSGGGALRVTQQPLHGFEANGGPCSQELDEEALTSLGEPWSPSAPARVLFARRRLIKACAGNTPGLPVSLFKFFKSSMHWRRKWQLTPVFSPGESQGRRNLVGCCLWGRTESDTTEAT